MISQTIASWISVLGVILALLAILQERITRVRNRDTGRIASDSAKMGFFYVQPVSKFWAIFGQSTKVSRITTISGLIEAGDMGMWTSAAVDQIKSLRSEICWVSLYRGVYKMVAQKGDVKFSPLVENFLMRATESIHEERWVRWDEDVKWEEQRRKILDELAAADEDADELERLRSTLDELDQTRIKPMRDDLYESSTNYKVHDTLSLPRTGGLLVNVSIAKIQRRISLSRLRRSKSSNNMKGSCRSKLEEEAQMAKWIRKPRPVNCVRAIPRLMKSTANPTPNPRAGISRPTLPRLRSTGSPIRILYNRSTSLNTMASETSRGSSNIFQVGRNIRSHLQLNRLVTHETTGVDDLLKRNDSGLDDIRTTWSVDQKPCVEISREELAALALVLGMQLSINDFTASISGIGGFGTSLYASQAGGYWKVNLVHGSRTPRLSNSQGSGCVCDMQPPLTFTLLLIIKIFNFDGKTYRLWKPSVL